MKFQALILLSVFLSIECNVIPTSTERVNPPTKIDLVTAREILKVEFLKATNDRRYNINSEMSKCITKELNITINPGDINSTLNWNKKQMFEDKRLKAVYEVTDKKCGLQIDA